MKFLKAWPMLLFAAASLSCSGTAIQNRQAGDTTKYVSEFAEQNEHCFICHGQERYQYANETLGTTVKDLMCTDRITKREDFYASNHKSFACTDCHSPDYKTFPHPGELRMELKYNCLDCHGGDENFAKFSFEEIDAEYRQSVHYKLEEDGFTCWRCHDPHTYKINIRNSENLRETIVYDNNICLNCHSDKNHLQLMSDKEDINLLEKHEWLPNQASHFLSVRCIECHAKLNDSILVAHQIVQKEEAVKGCNECHSKNSILMASLYKFKSKEQRNDGFFNGIILNESYVIGDNRNEYLNIISLVIFALVFAVIGVHIFFRIIKK
jgi:hypothetical protein